jgi:hypothetical protein
MPVIILATLTWAEARATQKAQALGNILHQIGQSFEAAIHAGAFDRMGVADGSVTEIGNADLTAEFLSSSAFPPYLAPTAFRDIKLSYFVGREHAGPVEGMIVASPTTERGSYVLKRLNRIGLAGTNASDGLSLDGGAHTINLFFDALGRELDSEEFAFATASVADLYLGRVIRQDRKLPEPQRMSTSVSMQGNTLSQLSVFSDTLSFATVEMAGQQIGAGQMNAARLTVKGATTTSYIAALSSASLGGALTAYDMDTQGVQAMNEDVQGSIVNFDVIAASAGSAKADITSPLSVMTSGQVAGGAGVIVSQTGTATAAKARVTNRLTTDTLTASALFSNEAEARQITITEECRGC